jgi:hypothetical protein
MRVVPLLFIKTKKVPLSFREAAWGFHRGYLAPQGIVEMACIEVVSGVEDSTVLSIASLDNDDDTRAIPSLLETLFATGEAFDEGRIADKWLYIHLAWAFDNWSSFETAFDEVEAIYAEFGYPEEISAFVRYMPCVDGYDPGAHSEQESRIRLREKWKNYLRQHQQLFVG